MEEEERRRKDKQCRKMKYEAGIKIRKDKRNRIKKKDNRRRND